MAKDNPNNRSASRAVAIFELFARERRCLFITEIAEAMNIPISSCYGLMKTLEMEGFAYSLGPRQGFYPTKKMQQLAEIIRANDPLERIVGPVVRALGEQTGETIILAQMVSGKCVAIITVESAHRVRYIPQVGESWPIHSTSAGRALLGLLPKSERQRVVDSLDLNKLTDRTVTHKQKLLELIEREIERGFHMSEGESIAELGGISRAVVINDQPFSLTINGPIQRIVNRLNDYAVALEEACASLSKLADPPGA
jgi:DNA-binding IclR family transcriptional regulator